METKEAGEGTDAKTQKRQAVKNCLPFCETDGRLDVRLGLAETGDALALFPLATLFEDGDALEALQDVALDNETVGALETFVL